MNINTFISMTSHFLAIALFIQALEIYLLSKKKSFLEIWSYENLKFDLEPGLPLPNSVIEFLFADKMVKRIAFLQLLLSLAAFIHPAAALFVLLFLCHLLICIRFRGTFNGGSDMMTFVLLTGMLIIFLAPSEKAQNLGFIYIAINTVYSYFKAGLAKVVNKEWRNGQALHSFLKRSLFLDTKNFANWLSTKKWVGFVFCWSVIFFELGIPTIFIFPSLIFFYFLCACLFHTIIFVSFGLNRFFWVWLAAWPSIFYAINLIALKK